MIERKVTFHSAASATAAGTIANNSQIAEWLVQITGTYVGTVTFQGTVDGSDWDAIQAVNDADGSVATTATAPGSYRVKAAGYRLVRCDLTWTSGTSITVIGIGIDVPAGAAVADIDIAGTEAVTISSIAAGTAIIGKIGIDQVTANANEVVLKAGTALAGKVGIDQVTANANEVVLKASEAHIGEVGGRVVRIQATKARPNDTTDYAANDAIAESASAGTVWTFTSMARVSGGSGTIIAALAICDNAANVARLDVDLYTVAPTAINDNAEATQLAADIANYVGTIAFQALAKKTTNSTIVTATPASLPRGPFKTSGSANLIGIVRTLDAFTPTALSNYYIILFVLQD